MDTVASLSGRKLSGKKIDVATTRGRFADELNFVISVSGRKIAHGKHFLGRRHYTPWIEVSVRGTIREGLLRLLCALLPPGSHIMVEYSGDHETEEGLKHAIPAPATPLGYMLWKCGCRWFKDWYFAEGFLEGGVKLQGEKPLGAPEKKRLEAAARRELQGFLARGERGGAAGKARKRATALLKKLG